MAISEEPNREIEYIIKRFGFPPPPLFKDLLEEYLFLFSTLWIILDDIVSLSIYYFSIETHLVVLESLITTSKFNLQWLLTISPEKI